MKKLNNKKGFTIVELVIVIAVIGILAGVLIPTFSGIQQSAKESAAFQECKNVLSSVLALNEGAIPANTLFAVDTDGKKYKFYYANQKLSDKEPDGYTPDSLKQSDDGYRYKIYVSATAVNAFLDNGVLKPNDDTSANKYTNGKLTADAISIIKTVLGVDLADTTKSITYSNDSGYLKITVGDNTTITCYYTSDIKSSIVVFLAKP